VWKTTSLITGSMLVGLLGACGGSGSSQPAYAEPAPVAENGAVAGADMACPFAASEVDVMVEDIEAGVSLTITGTEDQVESLRQWAESRAIAANGEMGMHGQDMHSRQGQDMQGMQGGMMMIPPADATTDDVPGGVMLTIRAKNMEDVQMLREQARRHAEMVRAGQCPMMQPLPDAQAMPQDQDMSDDITDDIPEAPPAEGDW
jgi:hypothetical protein